MAEWLYNRCCRGSQNGNPGSEELLPNLGSADYMREIDLALDSARHLVVVTNCVDNVLASWVEAEWRGFINENRSGRKTGNAITLIERYLR